MKPSRVRVRAAKVVFTFENGDNAVMLTSKINGIESVIDWVDQSALFNNILVEVPDAVVVFMWDIIFVRHESHGLSHRMSVLVLNTRKSRVSNAFCNAFLLACM